MRKVVILLGQEHKIAVKFGNDILEKGFTSIPNLVLNYYRQLGITFNEMMTIIHIWAFWWSSDLPYPSLEKLAEIMCIDKRNVRRNISSLVSKTFTTDDNVSFPLLKVYDRFNGDNSQTSSEYDFSYLIEVVMFLYNKDKSEQTNDRKYKRKARLNREDNIILGEEDNIIPGREDKDILGEEDNNILGSGTNLSPRVGQAYPPNNTHVNTFSNTNSNNNQLINTDRKKEREIETSSSSFDLENNNESINIESPAELIKKWSQKWKVPEQVIRIHLTAAAEQLDKGNMIDDLEAYIKKSVTKYLQQEKLKDYCRPIKDK